MWPFVMITESLVIPSYVAIMSLVFCIGVAWIYHRAHKKNFKVAAVLDVTLAIMVGSFVGARLFHVLFEHPEIYLDEPGLIYKFWLGGFVFYGGAIGGFIAGWIACRWRKVDPWKMADLVAPVVAFGYGVGRLGCLAAGCCFGRPTDLPWAIYFPEGVEASPEIGLHPTQVYAFGYEMIVVVVLLLVERKRRFKEPGRLFGLWLVLHGVGRACLEQFRGDFRGAMPLNLSLSTWISFLVIGAGAWLLSRNPKERRHASTTS